MFDRLKRVLSGKTTRILGDGPVAEKLRALFEVSGKDPGDTGPPKTGFRRWILCVGEINDLQATVEAFGNLTIAHKPLVQNPVSAVILSSKRNPSENLSTLLENLQGLPVSLRVCSIPSFAARLLLSRYALHLSADGVFGQGVHALILGFSDLGIAIALQVMRSAHYGSGSVKVTLAGGDPNWQRENFLAEFPEAVEVADLEFIDSELSALKTEIPVTAVYLCDSSPSEIRTGIGAVLKLLRNRQRVCPPVFVEVGGLPTHGDLANWDGRTYPFSAVSEVCDPGILFGDREDELARIVHDYYRDSIVAQGRSLAGNPAGEPWERLDHSYRQANRHQADHMAAKLASIDCRPVAEHESEFFVFNSREVEKLARIEHERWCADRWLNGWKYGPLRDNPRKIHPELIAYEKLSDDMKDLDRYTVRLMPALLGRQGLAIRRDLIVAVVTVGEIRTTGPELARALDQIFERLTQRFPDRGLVLAVDPADAIHRKLARRARERYEVLLWSLIGPVLDERLLRSDSCPAKMECLEILAHSERRICVAGSDEIMRWVQKRAHIQLIVADPDSVDPSPMLPEIARSDRSASEAGQRRIRFDPKTGDTRWYFEY